MPAYDAVRGSCRQALAGWRQKHCGCGFRPPKGQQGEFLHASVDTEAVVVQGQGFALHRLFEHPQEDALELIGMLCDFKASPGSRRKTLE